MRALLDVNMLLAMFDRQHIHHGPATAWWRAASGSGWASCAMTQNGFLRIVTQKAYARPKRLADARAVIRSAINGTDHEFWSEDFSILDPEIIEPNRLIGPRQLADIYLLALAVRNRGRLVTLDRGITIMSVRTARAENLITVL